MKVHSKPSNLIPIIIGFSLLFIGAAQITALWAIKRAIFPVFVESSVVKLQPAKFSPEIYWLEVIDNQIRLTSRTTDIVATSPEIALKDALDRLLAASPDRTTTIPEQTRLLDLRVTEDGIYIDLSEEFGRGGGSSSMIYRVAQILYTATSIDPQAPVFLSIAGQPLNEQYPLGGEGLLLEYPLTRQKFTDDFLNNIDR